MDLEEFRKNGKDTIDYMCDYFKNIGNRKVMDNQAAVPGFLTEKLPQSAPEHPEPFANCLKDVEEKIMPGVLHWHHPNFYAYFASGNSFPSILGEMLSAMFGTVGFIWNSCPSQTELEEVVLNWYGKAMGLPDFYHTRSIDSRSGACFQNTASDSIYTCTMAARFRAVQKIRPDDINDPDKTNSELLVKLTAYYSREAHSSIEKAVNMAYLEKRIVPTYENGKMREDILEQMIMEDIKVGLVPCIVYASLGTTSAAVFDDLSKIGPVCKSFDSIWLHVDGAYGGSALLCPEKRYLSAGIEYTDSFNTNPYKFMLTNPDCAAMWVRDIKVLKHALAVDPLYLKHKYEGKVVEYRNYGVPLTRRFRALKLWFTFRCYGISGLQKYQRNHMELAKYFESLVRADDRFEVWNHLEVSLVCFIIKNGDETTRNVCAAINESGEIHLTLASFNGKLIIRFCVTYEWATREQVLHGWEVIKKYTAAELEGTAPKMSEEDKARYTLSIEVEDPEHWVITFGYS